MSRYAAILATLNAKLQQFTGWSDANCAWPNRPFQPTPGTSWWKVDFIPASPDYALGVAGRVHEQGIYQVSRFEPVSAGAGAALTAADAMAAHFDRVTLAGTGVTVQTFVPEIAPPIQDSNWLQIPVSIQFIVT